MATSQVDSKLVAEVAESEHLQPSVERAVPKVVLHFPPDSVDSVD